MDYSKKLPDAEYDVMRAIWDAETETVTTAYLMEKVGKARAWKAPTLISFLVRLEERGYISSVKKGKERYYKAEADSDIYTQLITEQFVDKYHGGSFVNFMNALYKDRKLSGKDIDDLLEWLKLKY